MWSAGIDLVEPKQQPAVLLDHLQQQPTLDGNQREQDHTGNDGHLLEGGEVTEPADGAGPAVVPALPEDEGRDYHKGAVASDREPPRWLRMELPETMAIGLVATRQVVPDAADEGE